MERITIEFEDPHEELFVRLLAQEMGAHLNIEEFIHSMIFERKSNHPANMQCADEMCAELVAPEITMAAAPSRKAPYASAILWAKPATRCPQCGGPLRRANVLSPDLGVSA